MLRKWRGVVKEVADIIRKLYPGAEIYLAGGAAENRLTVYSDIDLLIVFKKRKSEKAEILARIWEALEKKIPTYYPLEIHILDYNELNRIKSQKIKL